MGEYNKGNHDVHEDDYYKQYSKSFLKLINNVPVTSAVTVDCANGIGAPKLRRLSEAIGATVLDIVVHNEGSGSGRLNEKCGADYVKVGQCAPQGLNMEPFHRYGSFDGDADRLVYYTLDSDCNFVLLDGDKIAGLFALYIKNLLNDSGVSLQLGVVQTAYANGSSTNYLQNELKVDVKCVPTGVKHLHHAAKDFHIGVYFEANGHGTVCWKPCTVETLNQVVNDGNSSQKAKDAANKLITFLDVINPTVGDAMSDMLAVEAILHEKEWSARDWSKIYSELPNRQRKVKVADRTVITTADAERSVTSPSGLQKLIDDAVKKFPSGRSFVRPSGTEDVVRVYAESDTQEHTDELASIVCQLVYDHAGGVGERPS